MASKLIFLAFLALALVAVHGEDDFKEVDNTEEELEYMESKVEEDEESEVRAPRRFKFGRFGRFGGSRSSSSGIRSSSSSRSFFRTNRSGGSSGIFRRTRTSGSSVSGGSRIFRRTRTSGGGSGGSRIFRRSTRTGTTGGNRSGGFRFGRRTGGNTVRNNGGSSGGFRFRRTNRRTSTGGGNTGGSTGGGGGISGWQKLGTVIDLAQLGAGIANTVLEQMSNVERKIVISLGNVAGAPWQGGTAYMKEGSLIKVLPPNVPVEEGVLMGGVKKAGPSATGVSGAFCYNFEETSESFCVMFKLPWSGDNQWNVKVYPEQKQASESVYNDLQNGAIKASQPITKKVLYTGDGYQFFVKDASMTSSGQANLQLSFGVENTE